MQKSVAMYLASLGYGKAASIYASKHIVASYRYSDKAFVAQTNNDPMQEGAYYRKVFDEMRLAYDKLGLNAKSLTYKLSWYKAFRHKNYPKITWNFFMEQIAIFGFFRLGLALRTTYNAYTKVSPAHNKHDRKLLNKALVEFWVPIAKRYKGVLPFEF